MIGFDCTNAHFGHVVVLHRVTNDQVVLADTAHGLERLSATKFCEEWTGYLIWST